MENKHPVNLKKTSEFLALREKGNRLWVSPWLFISFRQNKEGRIRYGVTANKKVGSSVVRNKLKRWCREFVRAQFKAGFNIEIDVNFVFRATSNDFYQNLSFREFERSANKAFCTIRKRNSDDS